jgi:Fur family ferric uptake transcriptional regulator
MTDDSLHAHGHLHAAPPGPASLRPRGRRVTRQRELIWAALTAEPDAHLSARDVFERVRAELPRVNPSTVYRTLEILVAEGLVLRTDLGADRNFYEPAHDHRHHHVVCRDCGRVAHVHDDALGDLGARVQRASGFALGDREVTLFGLCAACGRAAAPRRGRRPGHGDITHSHPHLHEAGDEHDHEASGA